MPRAHAEEHDYEDDSVILRRQKRRKSIDLGSISPLIVTAAGLLMMSFGLLLLLYYCFLYQTWVVGFETFYNHGLMNNQSSRTLGGGLIAIVGAIVFSAGYGSVVRAGRAGDAPQR